MKTDSTRSNTLTSNHCKKGYDSVWWFLLCYIWCILTEFQGRVKKNTPRGSEEWPPCQVNVAFGNIPAPQMGRIRSLWLWPKAYTIAGYSQCLVYPPCPLSIWRSSLGFFLANILKPSRWAFDAKIDAIRSRRARWRRRSQQWCQIQCRSGPRREENGWNLGISPRYVHFLSKSLVSYIFIAHSAHSWWRPLTFEFFDQVWSLSEQSQRAALVENLLNLFISGHMVVSKNGTKKQNCSQQNRKMIINHHKPS